jgi:hypothetical protein
MEWKLKTIDLVAGGGITMEGQTTNENVISLFAPRKDKPVETAVEAKAEQTESPFDDAIRRNEENRKRMIQERLKANKGVLKSYRIKN